MSMTVSRGIAIWWRRGFRHQPSDKTRTRAGSSHLDAFSFVLTAKHDFLDRFDPFVSTRLAVGAEVPPFLVRRHLEVMAVVGRRLDRDAVVKVDVPIREVWILARANSHNEL